MSKHRFFLVLAFGFVAITLLTHYGLYAASQGLIHSDFGIWTLTSDLLREGHWSFFQLQDTYGGILPSFLRAALTWTLDPILSDPFWGRLRTHEFITFLIYPTWMTLSLAYMIGPLTSRWLTKILTLVVGSLGLTYFIYLYMLDQYFLFLIFATLMTGYALRFPDFWRSTSPTKAAIFGLLCGLMHYTNRMSDIVILAYFFPWNWAWNEIKSVLIKPSTHSPGLKILRSLIWILLGFYFYLQTFGEVIGIWNGRPVKLQADPNLHYAVFIFLPLWFWVRTPNPVVVRKAFSWGVGFLIGFLPELISSWTRPHPLRSMPNADFPDFLRGLGQIPQAMSSFLGDQKTLLLPFSILLFSFGMIFLIRYRNHTAKHKLIFTYFLLTLLAFGMKRPYEITPARYLAPIFPIWIAGIAVFLDHCQKSSRWLKWGALGLILGHFGNQIWDRQITIQNSRPEEIAAREKNIIETFRQHDVSVVITRDFWDANVRTMRSNWNPVFWSPEPFVSIPLKAHRLAQTERRFGLLWKESDLKTHPPSSHDLPGRLKEISRIGPYVLFIGTKE